MRSPTAHRRLFLEGRRTIEIGATQSPMDTATLEQRRINHPLARGAPPSWAIAWGEDADGVWAEIGLPMDVRHRLRWMAPGRFWMGSPQSEHGRIDSEGPRHLVTISQGFWLGETPCTQGMWEAVMGENPSHSTNRSKAPLLGRVAEAVMGRGPSKSESTGADDRRRLPVENVTWEDCVRFFARLDEKVGVLPEGGSDRGDSWRLPREAEWEYGCRAGSEAATYAGGWKSDEAAHAVLDPIAWYNKNSEGRTHEVGLKEPNGWGLHDMLGNVWEWCEDGLREYGGAPEQDPVGPMERGSGRVIRGGSWYGGPQYVRAACRLWLDPADRYPDLGFRLARGPSGAPASQAGSPAAAEPL